MKKVLLTWAVLLCAASIPAWAAFERNYYTEDKLDIMRSNLEKYEWARGKRNSALAGADRWAKYDDERLLTLVVPPEVPRGYQIHNFGCPVHGIKVHEKGLYRWIIDFDNPWKVKCPVGGEEYPSNDFGAFLASGMKDRSLLTGDYPDDGWGWNKEGDETNYWFVAYYAHWSMSRFTMPAISSLGQAAIVAPDPEQAKLYAHKCALLLWQLAEYYPDYEYKSQSREAKEHNPNYNGKWTNMIWEVRTPNVCAPAYDAIRPFLPQDKALQQRAGKTAEEIDATIREQLLMECARCITDGSHRIAGNYGSHQRSLLMLAAVLGEDAQNPTREEMIEYIVENPKPATAQDIGLRDALVNLVYRDGMPRESIGYNRGWVNSLSTIAASLAEAGLGVNFFENPRFQRLLTWPFDVMIAGRFIPPLGDSGNMFAHGSPLSASIAALAIPYFQEPRIAQVMRASPGAGRDLFKKPLDEIVAELPEAEDIPFGADSFHFPAYGLAYLQSGGNDSLTSSVLFYGNYPCHAHSDQLNMLLFSQDNALLTDIGYPEQTDSRNHKRYAFFGNTVAHNTVVVDAGKQTRGPGILYAYQPTGFAQVVDASCEGAYRNKVTLYRRANMLVELSPMHSYLFDVFYVRGGSQHDYIALGAPSETSCDPPLGPVQEKGTLAGEDVPYEHFYDDERYAAKPLGSMSYGGYRGSGFQYLFNVRRAPLQGQAIFEWRLKEPAEGKTKYPWQGIGLRAHLIGEGDEIIAADSKPQKYKYLPDTIQFMLRRRTGEDLASNFVTVYEAYKDATFINSVSSVSLEPDDGQAVAARIELPDGSAHYVFHSLMPEQPYVLDGKVNVTGQAACLALDIDGKPLRAMLLNGTQLSIGDFALNSGGQQKTEIVSVDYANGIVEIADPLLTDLFLPGQVAIVAPDGFADSLTMQSVIDATHFSIGDEDLRVAGGPVNDVISDQNRIVTSVSTPHTEVGMTVLNSLLQPQGRLAGGDRITIDRGDMGLLEPESFPKEPDGSHPRFWVVMAGPGDELLIPSFVEFARKQ